MSGDVLVICSQSLLSGECHTWWCSSLSPDFVLRAYTWQRLYQIPGVDPGPTTCWANALSIVLTCYTITLAIPSIAQGSLLADLGMPGIESRPAVCRANALTAVLIAQAPECVQFLISWNTSGSSHLQMRVQNIEPSARNKSYMQNHLFHIFYFIF